MATNDLIVAIELGSSKIAGAVGRRCSDESLQVLAYADEPVAGFVRRGVVYNIDKTAEALNKVISTLEEKMDYQAIKKVYVGDGGYTLHSRHNVVTRVFNEETRISTEIVEEMVQENELTEYPGHDCWKVVPQEYKIGNNLTNEPVGINCTQIEGHYLNILGRASVMQNTAESLQKAQLEIENDFISPIVAANVVLTENERRQGCALVDFGADTTTISIYTGGILRFLSVLPLGGYSITRDLCSLLLEEHEAERLKREYGLLLPTSITDIVHLDGGKSVEIRTLHDVIEARFEEILINVCHQIETSGYADKLRAGIICCGGGINLKGIEDYLSRKTTLAKYRLATKTECNIDWGKEAQPTDGTYGVLIGLLMAGQQNCFQQKVHVEIPPSKYGEAVTLDIFTQDGGSAQEVRDQEERTKQEQKMQQEGKTPKKGKGFLSTIMDQVEKLATEFLADEDKDNNK